MPAKPESVYPYQFYMYYGELIEQNARYKTFVIDRQVKINQIQKELENTKADLERSGLYSSFRIKVLENDMQNLALSKTNLRIQRDEIRFRIEPILEKVLGWFDDIHYDFDKSCLARSLYIGYLVKYKDLLHVGNSLGIECYGKYPVINRINAAIEKYL